MEETKDIGRFRIMLEQFENTNVDFYNYEKFLTKVDTSISSIREMVRNNIEVIREDKEEIRKVKENPKIKTVDWSDSLWYRMFKLQEEITNRYEEQVISAMSILIEFQELVIEKAKKIFDSIKDVSEEKIKAETTKEIYDDIKKMFLELRDKDRELFEKFISSSSSNTDKVLESKLTSLESKLENLAKITEGLVKDRGKYVISEKSESGQVQNDILSKVSALEEKFSERKIEKDKKEIQPKENKNIIKEKDIEEFKNYLIERAKTLIDAGKSVKYLRAPILSAETRTNKYSQKYGLTREEIKNILDEVIENANFYTSPT